MNIVDKYPGSSTSKRGTFLGELLCKCDQILATALMPHGWNLSKHPQLNLRVPVIGSVHQKNNPAKGLAADSAGRKIVLPRREVVMGH